MTETYDASHITVLEGLTPVRERPAMYIGSTDTRGLHHLVYEVVDNSIDEALAGFCTRIAVVINKDGSLMVEDNGRGIPVDAMEKNHKSALEVVLTVLHAGGKFDKETYQVSGGLHGVGVSVVNALSNWLSARVYRDGNIYEMRFRRASPPRRSRPGRRASLNSSPGTSSGTVNRHRSAGPQAPACIVRLRPAGPRCRSHRSRGERAAGPGSPPRSTREQADRHPDPLCPGCNDIRDNDVRLRYPLPPAPGTRVPERRPHDHHHR